MTLHLSRPPQRAMPSVDFRGPFTTAWARECGLPKHELASLVARRLVVPLLDGVYVDASVPVDLDLRVAALALVAPPEAVAVDRTAAWLHGLDVLRRSSVHEAAPVEMYLAKDSRLRRAGIDSGRRGLLPRDVMELGGIQVTTPLRTALDLARGLWRYDALGALDQFVAHGVDPRHLHQELARFRGHRGVVQARTLLPLADGRSESMPESALRLHWHDSCLPWPHPQEWVYDGGVPRYRIDVADPAALFGGEYDGVDHHTSDEDRAHDRRRREWLHLEDWEIEVFDKACVYGFTPHPVDRLEAAWHRARQRHRERWTGRT